MKLSEKAREILAPEDKKMELARFYPKTRRDGKQVYMSFNTACKWIYSEAWRFNNELGIKALMKVTGLRKSELFVKDE